MKVIHIQKTEQVCCNCKHYIQHYITVCFGHANEYMEVRPVNFGHCTFPRVKSRKPGDSCGYFESEE